MITELKWTQIDTNYKIMKECIRCWNTEKDIRRLWIKTCYVWWGSYPRHDYSLPTEPNKDWIIFLK